MEIPYISEHPNDFQDKVSRKLVEKYHKAKLGKNEFKFNLKSLPAEIYDFSWKELIGVDCTQGGVTGIFLCQFEDNRALTVKGSPNVAQDYFTTLLYQKLAIQVPLARIVQYKDKEFKKMMHSLRSKTYHDLYIDNQLTHELDRPFLIVSEYYPTLSLLMLGPKRSALCFGYDKIKGYSRLRDLGVILALDLFLNNSDRIPLIWNNQGNPNTLCIEVIPTGLYGENLGDPEYVDIKLGTIFSVDSYCNCLRKDSVLAETLYNQHMERLERYIFSILRDLDEVLEGRNIGQVHFPSMEKAKEYFQSYANIALDGTQLFQIIKGIVAGLKDIADLEEGDLLEVYESARQLPMEDKMNVWASGMQHIDMQFLSDVKKIIVNAISASIENVNWVIRNYNIDESPLYM
ncbi:unnamed protein product [Blepharisma stoltei]|uniref:Actin-fragmin kinase catalytic domain-containing protein n=1 Tax=Blepharisma stoltei TaxID=1481888 RepID=A0AAU9K232_9CILI|nr:unnamed protein product [Blepharisma stoltei]